jgi:FkbM family methyltransferase
MRIPFYALSAGLKHMRAVHCFDNGVKVYDDQLVEAQRLRYAKCNVHEEDEEELFLEMINSLPAGGIFVSLGSAIGYYALLAKRTRPDLIVHCFEPLDRHRLYLEENIELNGYSKEDFRIHSLAVAPSTDTYLLVDRAFGSFLVKPEDARSRPTSPIESVTLSGIGAMIGSPVIDLVQMDIQGLEALILEDYVSGSSNGSDIQAFLIGTHGENIHERCRAALKQHNYGFVHDEFETLNQPDGILAAARSHP